MASNLTVGTIKASSIQQSTGQQAGGGSSSSGGYFLSTHMYKTALTANSNPNDTSGFTLRTVFNTSPLINIADTATWQNDGTFITIPSNGLYIVSTSIAYNNAAARDSPRHRYRINSTGQFEESRSAYIRVGSSHNQASTELVSAYQLSQGNTLSLEFGQAGNSGQNTTIIASYSYISIWKLQD